jgi:putative ABC transport system ATP-binding protein
MSLAYRCKDLTFRYQVGQQSVAALNNVTLDLPVGCFTCVTGPSGSGKSTLLHVLGLIEDVQQDGDVEFLGQSLKGLSDRERSTLRRFAIGFVFQSFHLIPVLSAFENVEYFVARQGLRGAERAKRVKQALESVGVWELRDKRPADMSGGQRQRVAIARALAKQPRVILADEPTANLDQKTGEGIMGVFEALARDHGVSLVLTSHDPMVLKFCPQVIRLVDGRLQRPVDAHGEQP